MVEKRVRQAVEKGARDGARYAVGVANRPEVKGSWLHSFGSWAKTGGRAVLTLATIAVGETASVGATIAEHFHAGGFMSGVPSPTGELIVLGIGEALTIGATGYGLYKTGKSTIRSANTTVDAFQATVRSVAPDAEDAVKRAADAIGGAVAQVEEELRPLADELRKRLPPRP